MNTVRPNMNPAFKLIIKIYTFVLDLKEKTIVVSEGGITG